ncbi:MAG: thiamine pyrophosphate-binding protein [Bacteroidales bacterium]|jgi:acetolactate synthase-1/2/3 large subunit|nr:thiamine pyrophosphate-binding protein [Bacteroidales bacterium]
MKVSDYIVSFLKEQGIRVVFGYIGGMITHLVDSIDKAEGISYIQTYHEQTAAIGAEGYARETNNFGVAISTSGPGITNMITGIADAFLDSVPTLFISGQVNTNEYKYDKPIRQQGFQELDVVELCSSITKYACLVDDAKNIRYELEKAISIAKQPRKGPVVLDIPMNIQRQEIEPCSLKGYKEEEKKEESYDIDKVIEKISRAKRPIIVVGSGIRDNAKDKLEELLNQNEVAVVCSLLGKGQVRESHKLFLGLLGSYGLRMANIAVAKSDLIIALGSRLDVRQTGAKLDEFEGKDIIQVDIDRNELENHRLKGRLTINCLVEDFIEKLISNKESLFNSDKKWVNFLLYLKENYSQQKEVERFVENKMPYRAMDIINRYSKEGDAISVDIGQNQMWAAQSIVLKNHQTFTTSGGLAPMGFSLPCAIGISFANPSKRVFAILGDGAMMISEQSLYIISQYNLPITILLLNNTSLGMITQFQSLYFNSNMAATTIKGGYKAADMEKLSLSHGLSHHIIEEKDMLNAEYLNNVFNNHNGVVEFKIEGLTTVSPKLEFDQPIFNPTPHLPKEELNHIFSLLE